MSIFKFASFFSCFFMIFAVLGYSQACMETAWKYGRLGAGEEIQTVTMAFQGSSCACCSLCHHEQDCASFGYQEQAQQCKLYRSVAGYDTLDPDEDWQYFVMPGRSGHHQFCRRDSDCTEDGDFCRGRVCTALAGVTCQVIWSQFGARRRYGQFISKMHGWINNTGIPLNCDMIWAATLIFKAKDTHKFTEESVRNFNVELADGIESYSILALADDFRRLGTREYYSLHLFTHNFSKMAVITIPRQEAVIGWAPRCDVGRVSVPFAIDFEACLPYYASGSPTLISLRGDGEPDWWVGSVARRSGGTGTWTAWSSFIYLYIKE